MDEAMNGSSVQSIALTINDCGGIRRQLLRAMVDGRDTISDP